MRFPAPAPAVRPEEAAIRKRLEMYSKGGAGVCSIALREMLVPRNLEELPVAKMPAPPCKEDQP
jgi:hypothetical protein